MVQSLCIERAGVSPGFRRRVEELRGPGAKEAGAADDENLAVRKERGRMTVRAQRHSHFAPAVRGRVVDLGLLRRGRFIVVVVVRNAARDEHGAVREQGGGVVDAGPPRISGGRPLTRSGIVELRRERYAEIDRASDDEHLAVGKPRCGVAEVRYRRAGGHAPGIGNRVVDFGTLAPTDHQYLPVQ